MIRHCFASNKSQGACLPLVAAIILCAAMPGPVSAGPVSTGAVGVRLTGQVATDVFGKHSTWHFEIVMEGSDHYYRREWQDPQPQAPEGGLFTKGFRGGDPDQVALVVIDGGDSWGEVASRLWVDNQFRGVKKDELRAVFTNGYQSEEFLAPVSVDNFPVPCVIRRTNYTEEPLRTFTYTVEKVEFMHKPDLGFFDDLAKKQNDERRKNSGEPVSLPEEKPAWGRQPAGAPASVAAALVESKKNPADAVKKLRAALESYPLDQPLGAYNQGLLMGDLWAIGGMDEKDELVNWFYHILELERGGNRFSGNGDMDDGSLYLLYTIGGSGRPELPSLLSALIADRRFDETNPRIVERLMEMCRVPYPIPAHIPLDDARNSNEISKWAAQWNILPLWRNALRRHFGLTGKDLSASPAPMAVATPSPPPAPRKRKAWEDSTPVAVKGVSFRIRVVPEGFDPQTPKWQQFGIDLLVTNNSDTKQSYVFPAWGNLKLVVQDSNGKSIQGFPDPANYMQCLDKRTMNVIGIGRDGGITNYAMSVKLKPIEITRAAGDAPAVLPPWIIPAKSKDAKPLVKKTMEVLCFTDNYFSTIYPVEGLRSVKVALQYSPLEYRETPLLEDLKPVKDMVFPGTATTGFLELDFDPY